MKFVLAVLLLCLNILRRVQVQGAEHPSESLSEAQKILHQSNMLTPIYPHRVGIKNHRYNCYMNSLFSCLYSIPFFQESVYQIIREKGTQELPQKSESVLMSLADIFVKMRLNKNLAPVWLTRTMFPAILHEMDWEVGQYRCVLEFWTDFLNRMPEAFQEVCMVKYDLNFIRKSDGAVIKSVEQIANYIDIPTSKSQIILSEYVKSNFLDAETEDYTIEIQDQEEYPHILTGPIQVSTKIPMVNTMTIKDTPSVLVFGVKRQGWDKDRGLVFNEVPIVFDCITVNNEEYVPVCVVLFNGESEHYFALVKDVSSKEYFVHNDTRVTNLSQRNDPNLKTELADLMFTKSSMFFYLKKSAHLKMEMNVFPAIRENKDIPDILLQAFSEMSQAASSSKNKRHKLSARKNGRQPLNKKARQEDEPLSEIDDTADAVSVSEADADGGGVADADSDADSKDGSIMVPTEVTSDAAGAVLERLEGEITEEESDFPIDTDVDDDDDDELSFSSSISNHKANELIRKQECVSLHPTQPANAEQKQNISEVQEKRIEGQEEHDSEELKEHAKHESDTFIPQQQQSIFLPHHKSPDCYREIESILSRFSSKTEVLGIRNFTFSSTEPGSFALQLVLTAMASNSFYLKKLFKIVTEDDRLKLEYQLATVLIQMLAGGTNISLGTLLACLDKFSPTLQILDSHPNSLDSKLHSCLDVFCEVLNSSLMKYPLVKVIIYSELVTDEPNQITQIPSFRNAIKISSVIPTRPANISGFYFDKDYHGNRLRSIFTSGSLIFPLKLDRLTNPDGSVIDHTQFFASMQDYSIIGGIFHGLQNDFFAEFSLNFVQNATLSIDRFNGGFVHKLSSEQISARLQKLSEAIKKHSHTIFVVKKSFWMLKPLLFCEIPSFLAVTVMHKINYDMMIS